MRYLPLISGWIRYLAKSFATSTFFAPFGIIAQFDADTGVAICLPSLCSGGGMVSTSLYSSFCLRSIASSVDSVPSKSMTQSLEWNALLSSASFQLIELGGMKPSL